MSVLGLTCSSERESHLREMLASSAQGRNGKIAGFRVPRAWVRIPFHHFLCDLGPGT